MKRNAAFIKNFLCSIVTVTDVRLDSFDHSLVAFSEDPENGGFDLADAVFRKMRTNEAFKLAMKDCTQAIKATQGLVRITLKPNVVCL